MSIYIEPKYLNDTYYEADKQSQNWFKPFDEYERISGNKISPTLGKNMPRVNDGSLAASLIETPMNVLPFMQTGKFVATNRKEAWLSEIYNIIWKNRIVPNANTQASYFDKEQIALYRALKYGAQPRYNFRVSTDKYTGVDWSLPYIRNVKLEPGKFSVDDCDYVFLDVYYTKLQLEKLADSIKGQKGLGWNSKAIKDLAAMSMTTKEMEDQNINERDKQINSSGIKTTICFQRGVDAPFYMFSKHLPEGTLLREWKNPDPTGDLPITMQYCYETLESPYGIGRVELAGPTQNVLDFMTQAHVLATQLGLQPPKKISGPIDNLNLDSIVQAPDAMWITGNAQVDVVQNTNSVYTQFPSSFGLYKSQLQTLQGRTDGSVSSTSGNPTFSKTNAGVNMQQDRTNAQDNYLRNKADTASARMAEKMMNTYMAQMTGADIIEVNAEDIERLTKAGYFDNNPNTPEPSVSEIEIIYEDIKDTVTFKYDPRPEADEADKNRWVEILDILASNPTIIPQLQAEGYSLSVGEVFKKIISSSGASDWEKVLVQKTPEEIQNEQTQEQMSPESIEQHEQIPEQPIQEPAQQSVGEIDLQTTMAMYGVDEDMAKLIMTARQSGFSEEEIANTLENIGGVE